MEKAVKIIALALVLVVGSLLAIASEESNAEYEDDYDLDRWHY